MPQKALRKMQVHLSSADIVRTASIMGLSTLLATAVQGPLGDVESALFLVTGILLASATSGLIASLLAGVLGSVGYNLLITRHSLSWEVDGLRDIAPLLVFLLCALIAGLLSGRLRDEAYVARAGNDQLVRLFAISRALQGALRPADLAKALDHSFPANRTSFKCLYIVKKGTFPISKVDAEDLHLWTDLSESAVRAELTIEEHGLTAFCLHDGPQVIGAVILDERALTETDRLFLPALVNLCALALARALLSEQLAGAEAVEQAERLKSSLLSSVSHDFRTPLTAIHTSASSLLHYGERFDLNTRKKLLETVLTESDRLARYTANLLELSRLETGAFASTLQPLGVADILRACVQTARARAVQHVIRLEAVDDFLVVIADVTLFEIAILNLLDNAIDYSPNGTKIWVRAVRDGSLCRIEIEDQGIGIPEDERAAVFERFYRVSRSDIHSTGSGLGLAIVRGFVEAFGGSVRAGSAQAGPGTCICIELPILEAGL